MTGDKEQRGLKPVRTSCTKAVHPEKKCGLLQNISAFSKHLGKVRLAEDDHGKRDEWKLFCIFCMRENLRSSLTTATNTF